MGGPYRGGGDIVSDMSQSHQPLLDFSFWPFLTPFLVLIENQISRKYIISKKSDKSAL